MPDPKDMGFGLNYNSGFGSGKGFISQQFDPQNNRDVSNAYNQRLGQQNAFDLQSKMFGQQSGFEREQMTRQLQQRDVESQRNFAAQQAQIKASMLPAQLQQQRFGQVFPYLRDALNGSGGFHSGYSGQGQVGSQPNISAAPVYSDSQIQQQVNAQRAGNDQTMQTQTRGMQQKLGGRGMGSNSPLSQALGAMYQGQNLQANTSNERETRMGAAGLNSKQVLAGQSAQEGQFASRQQEDIERNKVRQGTLSALLGALSGMV